MTEVGEWTDCNKQKVSYFDPSDELEHNGFLDALVCHITDGKFRTIAIVTGEEIFTGKKSLDELKSIAIEQAKIRLTQIIQEYSQQKSDQ